jgi:hypothetical protein
MSIATQQDVVRDIRRALAEGRQRDQLGIFDRPTEQEAQRDRARLQERLLPVVAHLAATRGPEGFTASDVIGEGMVRSILLRDAVRRAPRLYSWVGPWLHHLGKQGVIAPKTMLLATGRRVQERAPASRDDSKGRSVKVWIGVAWASA